jgi:hypothetical protein
MHTGQNPHQCRFARAVLANNSVHLAGCNGEGYIFKGMNARKVLVDLPDRKERLVLHRFSVRHCLKSSGVEDGA